MCIKGIVSRRLQLNSGFQPHEHQDAVEFLTKLFDQFSLESKPFEFCYHLLFATYSKHSKFCEHNHESVSCTIENILGVELEDPTEYKSYHLTNLVKIHYQENQLT